MNDRTIKLIGIDNFNKIKNSYVCVVGLGGVGGYAVEALVRSGIENIILVDYDKIDISNLNRQIISNVNNLDNDKTYEFYNRIISINPNCNIKIINEFINDDNINVLFKENFNYLIDACDTIKTKELLISNCINNNIKFISCMGTGNKIDPSKLEICDIRKTSYDPLAKIIRKYITSEHIKDRVDVIYSKEQNDSFTGSVPSMIFVPAVAGIMCANYIIRLIIEN